MTFQPLVGGIHLQAQIFDSSQHGIQRTEMGPGVGRDDPGQRCFADSRWAMQDQVADAIGLDGSSKQSSVSQDSALALKFFEAARPHAIRQWSVALAHLLTLIGKEVLAHRGGGDSVRRIGGTSADGNRDGPDRSFFKGLVALFPDVFRQDQLQTS